VPWRLPPPDGTEERVLPTGSISAKVIDDLALVAYGSRPSTDARIKATRAI